VGPALIIFTKINRGPKCRDGLLISPAACLALDGGRSNRGASEGRRRLSLFLPSRDVIDAMILRRMGCRQHKRSSDDSAPRQRLALGLM
jgi:hypothetical protein